MSIRNEVERHPIHIYSICHICSNTSNRSWDIRLLI